MTSSYGRRTILVEATEIDLMVASAIYNSALFDGPSYPANPGYSGGGFAKGGVVRKATRLEEIQANIIYSVIEESALTIRERGALMTIAWRNRRFIDAKVAVIAAMNGGAGA